MASYSKCTVQWTLKMCIQYVDEYQVLNLHFADLSMARPTGAGDLTEGGKSFCPFREEFA